MKIKTRKKNSSDLQPITKICFFILLHELHKPDGFKIAGFFLGYLCFSYDSLKNLPGGKSQNALLYTTRAASSHDALTSSC